MWRRVSDRREVHDGTGVELRKMAHTWYVLTPDPARPGRLKFVGVGTMRLTAAREAGGVEVARLIRVA